MEAIRKTVNTERLTVVIDLPDSMKALREVEIIVLPVIEKKERYKSLRPMKGFLKQYADPSLIEQEKGAWERAAVETYAGV